MTYSPTTLHRVSNGGIGSGPTMWIYTTADAHTAVDETDYFTSAKDRGLKVNDVVIVVDTNAPTCTIHRVAAVDADGNATIGAATLA